MTVKNDDKNDLLTQLHDLVMATIAEGLKPDYTLDEKSTFNEKAENIRDRLVLLRQKLFDHNTTGYQESSGDIKDVNKVLEEAKARIDALATFFKNLDTLAKNLDELLKAAM